MTISDLKNRFTTELSSLYTDSETAFLYSVFIRKIVGLDSFQQRMLAHRELLQEDEERLYQVISELKTHKPYQQILGETEFFGMTFYVNEHVLIPRPETEELLEMAVNKIKHHFSDPKLKILDIGTGSGIIPIVLKKHFPEAEVFSIDFSENALQTARKNAELHQLAINFIHQDYLNFELTDHYDIIISNPPYIGIEEEHEIADSVKEFEPVMALFSPTSDALIFYRKIAQDTERYLKGNGLLFLEINQKLGPETLKLYTPIFSEVHLIKDLSGNDRFIWGKK
ncbi:peptide chain release factor N(5)-glutamine methyltransferase [Chryseobacterium sp. Alg-005]|uniref:peptide chain release factor N(5)-glutamine methyltransferase n=1 Tax=Chryseobacterium sp. Alg-005 TaxID=3159516 RepID=UPI0035557FE4